MRRRAAVFAVAAAVLVAGCRTASPDAAKPAVARFYLEQNEAQSVELTLPVSAVRVAVAAKPVLTEFDVADVEVAQVELGKCLLFRFMPAAQRDLYRLTAASQGRRVVLVLNGEAIGARRIEQPFADGTLAIFVELPDAALPEVSRGLRRTATELRSEARKR